VRLHDDADAGERRADRGEQPGDVVDAEDALAPLRALAAAVADQLDVRSEDLIEPLDVPVLERVEETLREQLALSPVRLEPRSPALVWRLARTASCPPCPMNLWRKN
jgi:hypothetical protein